MNGLLLHCGGHSVNRNQLAMLPVPAPKGSRHVCRPFIEDVNIVSDELDRLGFNITGEAFGLAREGQRFFGTMEIAPRALEGEYIPAKSFALTVGIRGSYDQSFPRGLAVGSRVFVCDNLAFSGDVVLKTRQTTNISNRIGGLWRDAVAQIPEMADHQNRRFAAYRDLSIDRRAGDAMIVELVRRAIITPSQVGRVIAEWDTPSHDEHAEDGFTAWRLYNAVTEACKPSSQERFSLPALWERTIALTEYLDRSV